MTIEEIHKRHSLINSWLIYIIGEYANEMSYYNIMICADYNLRRVPFTYSLDLDMETRSALQEILGLLSRSLPTRVCLDGTANINSRYLYVVLTA
jgi:hypothetical protein